MGILREPYTISVWNDIWNSTDEKFEEQRICVIGSDKMESQSRALEPRFTRNVNGKKDFSFKMYKHYIDNITGEKVENPFVKELISERKIKLYLEDEEEEEDRWHDFIIKNIVEDSSGKTITCQLEDAFVHELSKNGFGVVLDPKVFFEEDHKKVSNIGTIKELANRALQGSDWVVDPETEAFVQTVEESLVYLETTEDMTITCYKCKDDDERSFLRSGVEIVEETITLPTGTIGLAFYSSCTDKPRRFQCIYLGNGTNQDYLPSNVKRKVDSRVIAEKNCQYFIDLAETNYKYDSTYDLYIPSKTRVRSANSFEELDGVKEQPISTWFRGERYNFAQKSMYHPGLDQYVQLYEREEGEGDDKQKVSYFGYTDIKYHSSALIQDLSSNGSCEKKSGWTGAILSEVDNATNCEAVYGYFKNNNFISAVEDLKQGSFDVNKNSYNSYIRVTLDDNSVLLNSGPRDHRTLIEEMKPGSKWAVLVKAIGVTEGGIEPPTLSVNLYDTSRSGELWTSTENIQFSNLDAQGQPIKSGEYYIFSVDSSNYNKENFKKNSNVQVWLTGRGTYYISKLELFQAVFKEDNSLLIPDEQASKLEELEQRVVEKTYNYVKYNENSTFEETWDTIKPDVISKKPLDSFSPVYNSGAQKTRAVEIKESNYFNILQTLAETFGAWLKLTFDREADSEGKKTGKVVQKRVCFKNYTGKERYAGFKYGVNLKNIQRTYESKNLVTKLIVKNNSNEYADNGFCTIARAMANPTGENYIYDFSYYHNQGLLDANAYIATNYVLDRQKSKGKDGELWQVKDDRTGEMIDGPVVTTNLASTTLQGYFPRLRKINSCLGKANDKLVTIQQDLIKLEAEKEVEQAKRDAALSSMDEVVEDFGSLTGLHPKDMGNDKITACAFKGPDGEVLEGGETELEPAPGAIEYTAPDWLDSFQFSIDPVEGEGQRTITFSAKTNEEADYDRYFYLTIYPRITIQGKEIPQKQVQKLVMAKNEKETTLAFVVSAVDTNNANIQSLLQEYAQFSRQYESAKLRLEGSSNPTKIGLLESIGSTRTELNNVQKSIEELLDMKKKLNQLFYSKYYRFIQEGTWVDEKYVDDDSYYVDALSVAYNSCYPQVAYNIGVVDVSPLEGYELYKTSIGDKTFVEDKDFFGEDGRVEVVITEITKMLDDPSNTTIKVQNFKNQFQDLFQKITATVQQVNYSTGAYEKAAALAEATDERKFLFLEGALGAANAKLCAAGQQSVTWGVDGITVQDSESPLDCVRIIGGAILLSQADKNGEQKWVTGVTSEGISANLITAGTINTGNINIMDGENRLFGWDKNGISAFKYDEYLDATSGVDENTYVRFNRDGIYGVINDPGEDVAINQKATFYLGWDGLKVTGNSGIKALIGKQGEYIIKVQDDNISDSDNRVFSISNAGDVFVKGTIQANGGTIAGWEIVNNSEVSAIRTANHNIGDAESFHMYSRGYPYIEENLFNSGGKKNWALTIGENFGVDKAGAIYATAGALGTWEIGVVNEKDTEKKIGIFSKDGDVCTGLVSYGDKGHVSIWAGACYTYTEDDEEKTFVGTPWEILNELNRQNVTTITWEDCVPFYVEGSGKVVCKDLVAKGGTIGGWTIDNNELQAKSDDEKVVVKLAPSTDEDSVISIENTADPIVIPSKIVIREASTRTSPKSYSYNVNQDVYIETIRLTSIRKGLRLNTFIIEEQDKQEEVPLTAAENTGYNTDITYTLSEAKLVKKGTKLTFTYNENAPDQTDIILIGTFNDSLVFSVGAKSVVTVNDLVVNNLGGKNISEVINELQASLTRLGFKGPYDIKYREPGKDTDTIVGQIYQLGTLVYGVLHSGAYQVQINKSFSIGAYIPGPYENLEVTWFVEYTEGVFNQHTHSVRLKKDNNGYLAMETTERKGDLGEYKARNWTYFCYSTENLINQHPTIDWV